MWWIATLALLAAAVLFTLSLWMLRQGADSSLWAGIKAFSEASMVGALADWFAVVALFRHPLGLPIPHTAVLVSGRERVAGAIGSFISGNFLTPDVLSIKVAQHKPALAFAQWCSSRRNAEQVMEGVAVFAPTLGRFLESNGIKAFLKNNMLSLLQDFSLSRSAAMALRNIKETPVADSIVGKLADEAVRFVRDNREELERQVAENLPIPSFMDMPVLHVIKDGLADMIAPLIVNKLDHFLHEVSCDEQHPLRGKIKDRMGMIADRLDTDAEFSRSFEEAKNSLLTSETLELVVDRLVLALRKGLLEDLLTPGTDNYRRAIAGITRLGKALKYSPGIQEQADGFIVELVTKAAVRYNERIKNEISSIVMDWDVKEMVTKVEEQVGSDLQYIRLNGTLVGGAVGLVLFLITWIL